MLEALLYKFFKNHEKEVRIIMAYALGIASASCFFYVFFMTYTWDVKNYVLSYLGILAFGNMILMIIPWKEDSKK